MGSIRKEMKRTKQVEVKVERRQERDKKG